MIKKRGKKGVSPVIASVLLTAIVVVGVAVVTLWGKGIQKDVQSKAGGIASAELECTSIDVEIISTAAGSVTVENNGKDIEGVMLVVKGDGESQSRLYAQEIKSGGSRSFPYTNIPGVAEPETVSIMAAVGKGIYRPCTDQKIDVEL